MYYKVDCSVHTGVNNSSEQLEEVEKENKYCDRRKVN